MMMKTEIEIISEECIKPSSPTPHHLKSHKLSFFDIYCGSGYVPVVLYYPLNQNASLSSSDIHNVVAERLQVLKKSLSENLSRFYPLAGKIKDAYSIECNDEGVYFVEVKVKSPLNGFLNNPNLSLITKFLPDETKWRPIPGNYVASVQVTTFSCGGIAVGVLVTHMIVDGTAFSSFLKGWAATAQNNIEKLVCPKFDASSIFPCTDAYPKEVLCNPASTFPAKSGKYITRRFVFDGLAIANLKAKAASSSVQNPTRVETLTALFGKCFKAILKESYGYDKPFLLGHAVNLRRRARSQFSEYLMGNFVWLLSFLCKDEETELHDFVRKLKETLTTTNEDFVNSLQGDGGLSNFIEAIKLDHETHYSNPEYMLLFSSWCNFGLYDLDFGWGKPAWVSIIDSSDLGNSTSGVAFMDTKDRKGIEVWISLVEEDMAILERDEEILAFATLNPSPLKQD